MATITRKQRIEAIHLHQLPHDALAAILQRMPAEDLDRLASVPCHAIREIARADNIWASVLCTIFGSNLAARVAQSAATNATDGCVAAPDAREGEEQLEAIPRAPEWLLELNPVQSWTSYQQALPAMSRCACYWQRQPTLRTAYRILQFYIPSYCISDSNFDWVQMLTCAEPSKEAKAEVLASFVRLNQRAWEASRDSQADDLKERKRVAGTLTYFLTLKKSQPGYELSKASCRAYVSSFHFKGINLVPALRMFLSQVIHLPIMHAATYFAHLCHRHPRLFSIF